jgi:hypothetical protein
MEIGDAVRYYDGHGKKHSAIVTQVWGCPAGATEPSLNLVYVSPEESETDQYGRQIKRNTSVVHRDSQGAHGCYWERRVTKVDHDE